MRVHLHASRGPCRTVCGLPCDAGPTAYPNLNPEQVTCPDCLPKEGS